MLDSRAYADWLHDEVLQPTVIVIGTETAKACIRETSGMSLSELFAPFGGFYRRIPVTYHVLEKPMSTDAYRVRFADADSAVQWSAHYAEQVGANMVEATSPRPSNDPRLVLNTPSAWYEQWRLALFRSLRWSEHEGLDQPAAALLVVSSKEDDPVFLFESLLHSSNLPPLCQQGVLDPVPARAAVLLHDLSDPDSPSEAALTAKLELVRARFVPHLAAALKVNSASEPSQEVLDLFLSHAAPRAGMATTAASAAAVAAVAGGAPGAASPPPGLVTTEITCARLGRADLDAIAAVASEVVKRSAVPWMETQLMQLEAQISQNRKGLRNQLKYLWRKPRESSGKDAGGDKAAAADGHAADGSSGSSYPLGTVEGQMRLAGDIAFLLRDYETALGYYRGVVTDFRQDRAWKHSAGAYEMSGICAYVAGMGRSEWDRSMENAYIDYTKAACGRHAMRVVCFHQAMMCDLKESAARLMRVNVDMSESGVRSALILEQAAQLYFRAGSTRKGAFHMVLAGHTFNKLQFKRLALHCYQSVASLYTSKEWYHITDHFYFTMARQAYGLGLLPESLDYFLSLLNSFTAGDKRVIVQADRESTYLKEFQFVVKNWVENCGGGESSQKTVDLQIPCIGPDITVFLPGDDPAPIPPPPPNSPGPAAPAGGSAHSPPSSADSERWSSEAPVFWEVLGERMLSSLSQEDRLELQWRDRRGGGKVFDTLQRVAPVGAELSVEIELSNPMRVKLEVNNAQLRGELVPPAGSEGAAEQKSSEGAAAVDFLPLSITLNPLETRRVRLAAIPRREGRLTISGVSWSLFDQVYCERPLRVRGRRLRATLEQRASKEGAYSTDQRLELKVRSQVPQVTAKLEGWPEVGADPQLLGELRLCTLVLSSKGNGPGGTEAGCAATLRVTTSHPAFVSFDSPAGSPAEEGGDPVQRGAVRHEGEVLHCDCRQLFQGSSEARIPVAVRASAAGLHRIRFCMLAEAEPSASGTAPKSKSELRQWITIQDTLSVRPSLVGNVKYTPSFQQEGRLIFSCSLENRSQDVVQLDRVWCIPPLGARIPLQPCDERGSANGQGGEERRQRSMAPGQQLHVLLAMSAGAAAEAVGGGSSGSSAAPFAAEDDPSQIPASSRGRLLAASRVSRGAAAPPSAATALERRASLSSATSSSSSAAGAAAAGDDGGGNSRPQDVDLAVEWSAAPEGGSSTRRRGELYTFSVPRDRGGAPPCPLEMRLLAPDRASPVPAPPVEVTLFLENVSPVGDILFYIIADTSPGFMWLGCERSEVIRLPPLGRYQSTLQACFPSPGVYDLNRLRFFVVGMPAGPGAVPCTEQAPLAFSFPFERLIHVSADCAGPGAHRIEAAAR